MKIPLDIIKTKPKYNNSMALVTDYSPTRPKLKQKKYFCRMGATTVQRHNKCSKHTFIHTY